MHPPTRYPVRLPLLCLALFLLLGPGCAWIRNRNPQEDVAQQALDIGDRLYMQRGSDPAKVDAAIDVWTAALVDFPDHPGLLRRLAEAWLARAQFDPQRMPADLDVARRYGIRCLRADPAVRTLVSSSGRLEARAIRRSSDVGCLTWTALAWGRWLDHHGAAGAAIDLPVVQAAARRAVELDPDFDQGRPHHALGLALALPPMPLRPDLAAAEKELLAALEAAPFRWMVAVDLAELVYARQEGRQGEAEALLASIRQRTLDQGSPPAYLNQAAQRRAAGILEAGTRPRWGP